MAKKAKGGVGAASGAPPMATGISAKARAKIAQGLSQLLADRFSVYL